MNNKELSLEDFALLIRQHDFAYDLDTREIFNPLHDRTFNTFLISGHSFVAKEIKGLKVIDDDYIQMTAGDDGEIWKIRFMKKTNPTIFLIERKGD